MGKRNLFLKKRKVFVYLLAVVFLLGEILQPMGFLRAEESTEQTEDTVSGIEISVVTVDGGRGTASADRLETALKNLKTGSGIGIQLSRIKELVITGGQIKEEDWTYIGENNGQFSNLTDFRAEGTERGTGRIPYDFVFPRSVERVEIPDGITSIGYVFKDCQKVREITIPGSIKQIQSVFDDCVNLVKVNLSDGVEIIGEKAFRDCKKLEQIKIPDSVTRIYSYAFGYCEALKEVILPQNLEIIYDSAFVHCKSLLKISIPDHVTTIHEGAFAGCDGLREVVFPKSLVSISTQGYYSLGAFSGCTRLKKVVIPGNVKTIGSKTFSGCSNLKEVVMEEGVETIGTEVFADCVSLTEVTVPASATLYDSFKNCSKLSVLNLSVNNEEEVTAINAFYNSFAGCPDSRKMYFYTEDGLPLSDTTVPTFSDAAAAYRAVRDNDPSDDLWWGWQMEQAYSVVSHLTNLTGSNAAAGWRDIDGDYMTTLTPAASAEGVVYSLPAEIVVKIGGRTALPEDDYTYDPDAGTLLIKETSIDGNIEIEAAADESLQEYKVIVKTMGNGKVTVGTGESPITMDKNETKEITVFAGDQVLLSLLPDDGASLVSLLVDGEEKEIVGNEYSLTDIQDAHMVQIVFTEKAVETPSPSPDPTPTLDSTPTPSPDPTPSPTPTLDPTPTPSPDPTPTLDPTPSPDPTPTPILDKDVSDIADGLGVSGETAQKIQEVAKELDVSKDTILVTDSTITSQKTDDDIKGAYFARIQARIAKTTQNNIKLVWNKVKGADGYFVYGNRCNTKKWIYEYKLAKTITNRSKCSYINRKCKKGSYYKFIVRAYKNIDGKKVTIAVSKTIHVVTDGGRNGNAGSVKVNRGSVSLKKGKKFRIKAKEIKQKKKLQYHRKVCYESSNPKVASVSKKGVIKAKKKGKCTIYAYAQSGIYKKIKVTVK